MITKFNIEEPIWKDRSVGLAEDKMSTYLMEVNILYKNKDGKRLYPNPMYITKTKAMMYPKMLKKCVKLRIIPIRDLNLGVIDSEYVKE